MTVWVYVLVSMTVFSYGFAPSLNEKFETIKFWSTIALLPFWFLSFPFVVERLS